MLKRFPQLQSGFVASGETLLVKPERPEVSAVGSLLAANPRTRSQEEFFYSPEIDSLVNEVIQDPLKLRSLAFQGKVMFAIGRVFEKQSFTSFIRLQEDNPHLSSSHLLFLEETINVALGLTFQRSVSLQTWASMLSNAGQNVGGFRSSTFFEKFKHSPFLNMSLADFVLAWIRNAGYSDLIIGMQVLFGRRTLHASYGAKL